MGVFFFFFCLYSILYCKWHPNATAFQSHCTGIKDHSEMGPEDELRSITNAVWLVILLQNLGIKLIVSEPNIAAGSEKITGDDKAWSGCWIDLRPTSEERNWWNLELLQQLTNWEAPRLKFNKLVFTWTRNTRKRTYRWWFVFLFFFSFFPPMFYLMKTLFFPWINIANLVFCPKALHWFVMVIAAQECSRMMTKLLLHALASISATRRRQRQCRTHGVRHRSTACTWFSLSPDSSPFDERPEGN